MPWAERTYTSYPLPARHKFMQGDYFTLESAPCSHNVPFVWHRAWSRWGRWTRSGLRHSSWTLDPGALERKWSGGGPVCGSRDEGLRHESYGSRGPVIIGGGSKEDYQRHMKLAIKWMKRRGGCFEIDMVICILDCERIRDTGLSSENKTA